MKTVLDEAVVMRIQEMCEESLDPETFEQWETVKEQLLSNRGSLKHFKSIEKFIKGSK